MLVSSLSVWPRLAYPSWISLWTTESRTLCLPRRDLDQHWDTLEIYFQTTAELLFILTIYFCTLCFTIIDLIKPYPSYQTLSYLKADLVLSLLGVALDGVGRRHRWRVDVAVIRHDQTVAPVVHLQTGQVYLYLCFSVIYYRWDVVGDIGQPGANREVVFVKKGTCDMICDFLLLIWRWKKIMWKIVKQLVTSSKDWTCDISDDLWHIMKKTSSQESRCDIYRCDLW